MHNNIIVDFIYGLEQSLTIHGCFDVFSRAVSELGFDSVAYSSIPIKLIQATSLQPQFLSSASFSSGFLKHYAESGLEKDDFTIKRISQGDTRVMNWRMEEKQGQLLPAEVQLIRLAREDYGVNNALSIPTLSDEHHISGVSIISESCDQTFQLLLNEKSHTLQMICQVFHDRVYSRVEYKKFFYLNFIESLSKDEKAVLKFVASGMPLKLSRDICGISPSYAGNIRSSLFDKLQVKNSAELIYLISLHRIIEML
ncbi:MAG: autoinducer binding domain-containing protein [Pseudomonadales bacterium]|nr:autoinducer binding domain-containing protein [Pseudomonadales bacterium]